MKTEPEYNDLDSSKVSENEEGEDDSDIKEDSEINPVNFLMVKTETQVSNLIICPA